MNELEVSGLQVHNEKLKFLHNIRLKLKEHDFVAIVGNNGSGKTTLLHALYNFFKTENHSVSILRQSHSINFNLSVKEFLLLAFDSPLYKSKKNNLFLDFWLKKLRIEHLRNKNVQSISGGEFQLVRLAQLFLLDTAIVILDEPDSNLDHKNKLLLFTVLKELSCTKSVICTSHSLGYLGVLSGKLLTIYADRISVSALNDACLSKTITDLSI